MIRLHVAMARQLRAFMEGSGISWSEVTVEHGEAGRVDCHFRFGNKLVEVYVIPPSQDPAHRLSGEPLPHGRLAGRVDGGPAISGPIDPATWAQIDRQMRSEPSRSIVTPVVDSIVQTVISDGSPSSTASASASPPIARVPEILEGLYALEPKLTTELIEQLQLADIATLQKLFPGMKQVPAPAETPAAPPSQPRATEIPAQVSCEESSPIAKHIWTEDGHRIGEHASAFAHIRQSLPRGSGWA
jgi:hypothetical protein